MKVIALGATGWFGQATAALLAASEEVSEIVIAGRNLELARDLAAQLGSKASVAQIDVFDDDGLDRLVRGARLLVNTSGPYFQTLLPVLMAAIRNKINYCDFSEDWQAMERALAFDAEAREAGITAIVGMGDAPGLTNLMAYHAAHQLDEVEQIKVGWLSDVEGMLGTAQQNVDLMRATGRVSGCLQAIIHALSSPIRNLQQGQWTTQRPFSQRTTINLPGAGDIEFNSFGSAEPNTLPRALPGVWSTTAWMCLLPFQLNDLLRLQAARITAGEINDRMAAADFFQRLVQNPEHWLKRPDNMPYGAAFAICSGRKDGKPVRYGCIPAWGYRPEILNRDLGTAAPLAAAALRMLRGEITRRGVMSPEACIDPLPFFREIADRWATLNNGSLLMEWWEPMEEQREEQRLVANGSLA